MQQDGIMTQHHCESCSHSLSNPRYTAKFTRQFMNKNIHEGLINVSWQFGELFKRVLSDAHLGGDLLVTSQNSLDNSFVWALKQGD